MTLSIPRADLTGIDVLAAGAVLWRAGTHGPELALVHRPRYDDWSFPKGKLDAGEAMPFAAAREVSEETGYGCRLGALLGDVEYQVPEGSKLVRYWAAEARGGGEFTPNHETDELRWASAADAAKLLSYQRDLDLLRRFTEVAPPHSVVLLVRHAKAGSRHQWDGDDALRPLSGTGREQARHLTDLLAAVRARPVLQRPATALQGDRDRVGRSARTDGRRGAAVQRGRLRGRPARRPGPPA